MIKKLGIKKCELCKNDFEYNTGNKRESLKRFCSSTCAKKNNGLNNKGRTHTDAWKEMMSIRNTGENNPFYGKKHSDVSINKMSESSLWDESKYRYCNISAEEMEIFDGILISDGSLDKSRISARISLGFKYMGTIRRIINDLPSISFLNPWEYNPKPDIRTGKSYKTYNTKSNFFHNFKYLLCQKGNIDSFKQVKIFHFSIHRNIKEFFKYLNHFYIANHFQQSNHIYPTITFNKMQDICVV